MGNIPLHATGRRKIATTLQRVDGTLLCILFGLSRQEAAIYLCLLQNEELTGYEVAKLTGISRSNVYNGLASLVEHGAAYVIEGTSSKYLAVALSEFCDNRIRYLGFERCLVCCNKGIEVVRQNSTPAGNLSVRSLSVLLHCHETARPKA